ncbi:girdin-like [Cucumis melo var. makuwa]|uniref:Girdin-like n=1 Tax=Cucumis melo var. makuwa TaxID=1194695 RepID=A0A5A7T5S7_CUCMM|nr:girdin-like [Cucumis melo var. makuwa]
MSNMSMHSSFESKFDEPSDVLKWAEEMQQKFGDALTPQRRFMFSKKYGHIAELMYIPVNYFALRAIINFGDPAYGCFTFGSCNLLPTIEEYQAMLSMPEKEREIVYFFNPKQTTKRTLSKFLETVHATEIQKYIKVKGGEENVPFDYLIKMTQTYIDEDKGLTLLALCIYGAVIFPKAEGYVDRKVIKLFFQMERGVNPIIPILAETFRSLNYCRNKGEGKLNCCVPLLYIWIHSHIKFPAEFRCPRLDFSSPWNLMRNTISEFGMAVWDPTYPRKEAWLSFFAKLTSENVIWKAQWMPLKAVIYRCGDFHSVPLLGPWGGVNYTPLLVLRQVWLKQFIPPTHNLQESDFSYDPEDCQGKKRQAVCAWKSIRKIKDKGHYEGVTSGYEAWQANRRKNIIDISREVVESGKETSFEQPNQWIEKSIELEEKNRLLEQENEKLRKETSQWMDHATYLQNELEKTKSFLKNQDKLEKDLETLDEEMRRMNKANRSLKNEKTTLQATVGLHLKMAERSEEYEILKNYADSLHYQLTALQNSSKRITQEYESLNTDYVQMKVDYDLHTRDFQVLVERVDQTIEFLRMVSKRADGFAEWAVDLRVNFFSMQPHADDLNRFLKMICRELGHFGHFH